MQPLKAGAAPLPLQSALGIPTDDVAVRDTQWPHAKEASTTNAQTVAERNNKANWQLGQIKGPPQSYVPLGLASSM